jgi:hypothetical protein
VLGVSSVVCSCPIGVYGAKCDTRKYKLTQNKNRN